VRCSITSRNSPPESASAPSAERRFHFIVLVTQTSTRRAIKRCLSTPNHKILQKTCAPPVSLVTPMRCGCRCGQLAAKLRITGTVLHNRPQVHNEANVIGSLIHNSLTTRHTCHAAPTYGYPQCPQALLLLLVYLLSFSLEEGTWGHIDPHRSEPLCGARCHPDRLAFKLSRKALRWFSDSRYGR
jgi:hypothetical protein